MNPFCGANGLLCGKPPNIDCYTLIIAQNYNKLNVCAGAMRGSIEYMSIGEIQFENRQHGRRVDDYLDINDAQADLLGMISKHMEATGDGALPDIDGHLADNWWSQSHPDVGVRTFSREWFSQDGNRDAVFSFVRTAIRKRASDIADTDSDEVALETQHDMLDLFETSQ